MKYLFDRGLFQLRWVMRLFAVGLGAAISLVSIAQQSMNEDGISYLDIGEAFYGGNYGEIFNAHWSPLYAIVQGGALALLQPSMDMELVVVHGTNFLIYVLCLLSFEFFWNEVTKVSVASDKSTAGVGYLRLPPWTLMVVGYLLFVYGSLYLIEIWAVTPDMLFAVFLLLAGGLFLKIGSRPSGLRTFAIFGVVLGIGYYAKAAMFATAILLLLATAWMTRRLPGGVKGSVIAVLVFATIAGPLVVAISAEAGQVSVGAGGRHVYIREVNQVPPYRQSSDSMPVGVPDNPVNRISAHPRVYEFSKPVGGTYPLHYDPTHWYLGLAPVVETDTQLKILAASGRYFTDLFLKRQGLLLGAVLILLLLSTRFAEDDLRRTARKYLLAIVGVVLVSFAFVYTEDRYIGAFILLFWGCLFGNIAIAESAMAKKLLRVSGTAVVTILVVMVISFNLDGLSKVLGLDGNPWKPASAHDEQVSRTLAPTELAKNLRNMGISAGDSIGYFGYPSPNLYFARLLDIRVVAEVPEEDMDDFWRASPERKREVFALLSGAGVTAVIAEDIPASSASVEWQRISDSRHHILFLDRIQSAGH
jgi:hypothetical protein